MARVHVLLRSSTLSRAAYEEETETLDVTFKNGRTYTYEGVPKDVFEGLRDAPSAGQYFHSQIRDRY